MTELGNRLKEAREAKGLSLADVQEATKIQKRYLAGIEEGNYDIMPGKFYIRAFIKQYAEAVGLNSEELFEQYKNEIPSSHEDEVPQRATKVEQVSHSVPQESSKILEYLPKILLGAFIIGAVFLVWVLIPKGGADKETVKDEPVQVEESAEEEKKADQEMKPVEKEKKDSKEVAKVEEPASQKLTAIGTAGRKTTYELTDADKFEVTVLSKGETWLIVSDGNQKKYFNNMLKSGESQTFDLTGQTEAKIVVGFAPDAEIKVNGETLNYKLPPDQQVRQDILIQMKKAAQ